MIALVTLPYISGRNHQEQYAIVTRLPVDALTKRRAQANR